MGLFSRKKEEPITEPEAPVEEKSGVGPWDEADRPERDDLIDAGALLLPPVDDAAIQFSVERARSIVLGVVYIKDQTAIQLQVFAAPKSADQWADVRADLITQIAEQGGKFTEAESEFGSEVRARMPLPNDQKGVTPVRYIGIDGPRWMLRVTVSGKAVLDDELANRYLHEILDHLVVVRGQTPYPPREILPLQIPRSAPETKEERPKLELPKRGPEISEVR